MINAYLVIQIIIFILVVAAAPWALVWVIGVFVIGWAAMLWCGKSLFGRRPDVPPRNKASS